MALEHNSKPNQFGRYKHLHYIVSSHEPQNSTSESPSEWLTRYFQNHIMTRFGGCPCDYDGL
jgi:hypothetical protein